jgi:CheY-like chemotaxis protein
MSSKTKPKIMIVDDEMDVLSVTESVVQNCGYETEAFSNPLKALERYRQAPKEFAVVLTDIRMPGLDGLHLASEILTIKAAAKIMMTAFQIDSHIFDALPVIRKDDIVSKPFDLFRICQQIQGRLNRN